MLEIRKACLYSKHIIMMIWINYTETQKVSGTPENQELTGKYHRKSIFFVKQWNDRTVTTVILVVPLCRFSMEIQWFCRKPISLGNKKRNQNIPAHLLPDLWWFRDINHWIRDISTRAYRLSKSQGQNPTFLMVRIGIIEFCPSHGDISALFI